jgi:hypothetical protein
MCIIDRQRAITCVTNTYLAVYTHVLHTHLVTKHTRASTRLRIGEASAVYRPLQLVDVPDVQQHEVPGSSDLRAALHLHRQWVLQAANGAPLYRCVTPIPVTSFKCLYLSSLERATSCLSSLKSEMQCIQ